MTYKEIKAEISKQRTILKKVREDFKQTKLELKGLEDSEISLKEKYEMELRMKRNSELKEIERVRSEPFNRRLTSIDENKRRALEDKEKLLAKINIENYKQDYQEKIDVNENLEKMALGIETLVKELLGSRFSNVLYSVLENKTFQLDYDDVDDLKYQLDLLEYKISKVSFGSAINIHKIVDKGLHKINLSDEHSKNVYAILLFIVFSLVITLLLCKFILPFLFIFLLILSVVNLISASIIYDCIVTSKMLLDNISEVSDAINNELENKISNDRDTCIKKYDSIIDKLSKQREETEANLQSVLNLVNEEYEPSTSLTSGNWETEKISLKTRIKDIQDKLEDLSKKDLDIQKELRRLEDEKKRLSAQIADEYLCMRDLNKEDFLSMDKFFNKEYFYSIESDEPVIFNHTGYSSLFLYYEKDLDDIKQFINLQILQILNKMMPGCYNCYLIDLIDAGIQSRYLTPHTDILDIVTESSIISNLINDWRLKIHDTSIKIAEFGNIDSYNRKMIDIDAVTESYTIIHYLRPKIDSLGSEEFTQILRSGGDVGIILNAYCSYEEFIKIGDKAKELLTSVGTCYRYMDGHIRNIAKDFLIEELEKNKK